MRDIVILKAHSSSYDFDSYSLFITQVKDWDSVSDSEFEELKSAMAYMGNGYNETYFILERIPTVDDLIVKAKQKMREVREKEAKYREQQEKKKEASAKKKQEMSLKKKQELLEKLKQELEPS